MLIYKGGDHTRATAATNSGFWQRSSDWLEMPSVGANEEVAYLLYAVWDTTANPVALSCTGNYTVDWGDGTITNYNSGVTASHNYSYSSINSIVSTRGYKMVMIKVAPQSGATITAFNINRAHPSYASYVSGTLEGLINFSSATYSLYVYPVFAFYCEYIYFKNIVSGQNCNALFNQHTALEKVKINTFNPTNATGLFTILDSAIFGTYNGFRLKEIEMPCENIQIATNMFSGLNDITDLSHLVFNSLSPSSGAMVTNCHNLRKYPTINNWQPTSISSFFNGTEKLRELPEIDCTNVTSASAFLNNYYTKTVTKSGLFNVKISLSYVNQMLDYGAISNIINNLIYSSTPYTLTITGNPGAAAAMADSVLVAIANSANCTLIN